MQVVAMPISGYVMFWDTFESIWRYMHFTDNISNDKYEGQQKLFRMYMPFQVPDSVSIPTTWMPAEVANCICPPGFFWGGGESELKKRKKCTR
jgi:hypothetical protein